MSQKDEEKTTFITDSETYYYREMSFELKNAGAIYQKVLSKIFRKQIG